jgi:RRXRR protein
LPGLRAVGYQGQLGSTPPPSYVADRFKTDVRMLPQFRTSRRQDLRQARDRHETGLAQTLLCDFPEGRLPARAASQGRTGIALGDEVCRYSFSISVSGPLVPCREKRARLLLESGRLLYRYPFTIHLKDPRRGSLQPVRVKLDPGSKTTGVAVVTDADGNRPAKVLALFELARRGRQISEALTARRACGVAAARIFATGHRGSLTEESRRAGFLRAFSAGFIRACPGSSGCVTRLGDIPNAFGLIRRSKTREYLVPSTRVRWPGMKADGTASIAAWSIFPSTLTTWSPGLGAACIPCNAEKDARPIEQFLANDPKRLAAIKAQAKAPEGRRRRQRHTLGLVRGSGRHWEEMGLDTAEPACGRALSPRSKNA